MLCTVFANGGVLYPWPSFVYYRIAAMTHGMRASEVPLGARFELDEAAVIAAIERDRPSVVFLALPNNPTGALWRMDFALELAARYRDIAIVSDEAYIAFCGKTNLPHLDAHPNLVVMRTLSKMGMAGLRVGFVVASRAIAALVEKVRPPYNLSSLDQRAASFLLTEAGAWCEARAAEVVAERAGMVRELERLDVEVFPTEANLVLIRTKRDDVWRRLAEVGISVRAFSDGALAGCIRITIGTPAENRMLLARLAEIVAG
jgi:histidinol-phosphate aminotransferase